jgi:hypothetical protein
MDGVHLRDEIGDRQLQLVQPQPVGGGGEVMTLAEIEEDVGDLRDRAVGRV